MKKIILAGITFTITMTSSAPLWAGGWIVKLNRTQSAQGFLRGAGLKGRVLDKRSSSRWIKLEDPSAGTVGTMSVSELGSLPGVEYIERDQVIQISTGGSRPADPVDPVEDPARGQPEVTPNDAQFSKLWGLANVNTAGSTRAPHAWFHARNRSLATVVVGVLDTGVNYNHEDLKPILYTATLDGKAVRGIDTVRGDFVADDEGGHGSHVSGTIAGKANNGVGVAGIAPNARIFPMKFLGGNGKGNLSDAIEAIDQALEIGEIKVMNHSWGGGGSSRALEEAFERARARGVLMVVAASNSGKNNDTSTTYPANIPLDNVISVAAIDVNAQLASFSNYGKKKVHLGAPGVNIFSSIETSSAAYDSFSGTSMAAPHVTGAAAFVWGLRPEWTYQQVRELILRNVRPLSSLKSKTSTGGTLDLYRAVRDL